MFERLFSEHRDEATIVESAKNNQRDFACLYDLFVDRVYHFIRWRVSSNQDAEDIVSETFMAVALALHTYDAKKGSFSTWLFTLANRKFLDKMRVIYKENEVIQVVDTFEPEHEVDYIQLLTDKHIYEHIISFVKTLSDRQSSLFFLRYVEELPNKEIAQIYDLDERTVSSTLSLVCTKIKKHLGKIN